MKKIFTFCAAVLASVSLIAAEPNLAINTESQGTEDFVKAYEAEGITLSSTASFSSGAVQLGNTPSSYDQHYFEVLAGSAEIDSISFLISGNGSNKNIQAPLFGWAETATSNTADTYVLLDPKVVTANSYAAAQWFTYDLSKAEVKCARIYRTTKYVSSANPEYTGSSTALGTGQTIKIYGLKVWLKETKTIVSTVESLTAVTINDVAISATDLATLVSNKYLFLQDAYVTAPVVKFTKHTVITYDDQSTKVKDEVIEVTSQPATTTWGASATINGDAYYVYAPKAASRTVTYMYGEQVLGTETVAVNGNPAEYAQYETMPLATFGGWYKDADLTQAVANIAAEVISVDATYYAAFDKAFLSESVNIEQLVLDYGTNYDIKTALTAAGWGFENLNSLDSLNDLEKKDNRNYAFLGLKLKTAGAYIQGWIPADGGVVIKFGNLGSDIKVTITGANTNLEQTFTAADLAETDNEFQIWGFTEEVLVKISTVTGSTVVLKQLMLLNEGIQEVTLPAPGAYAITLNAENGTLEAAWEGKTDKKVNVPVGATVTLTATPAEGYKLETITVNEVALEAVEGVYSFTMPAQAANVVATFVEESGTGITNTEAAVKAVKVVREGKLFIEKGGVLYNAQGNVVK